MQPHAFKAWVSGKVQGVYFRASTREQAQALELVGYAKNLPDGRVEVVAEGSQQALDALLRYLSHGPAEARVDDVSHRAIAPSGFRHFTTG